MQSFARYICLSLMVLKVIQGAKTPPAETFVFPDKFVHHHHHHHHYHDHDENYNDDTRKGGPRIDPSILRNAFENVTEIPLEFAEKVNQYEVNDLLLDYVDDYHDDSIRSRFGEDERSNGVIPKSAKCMPELKTVEIASSEDPSIMYLPSCTRVERCGGCCSHTLLSCQPTDVELINYQVIKTKYTGGNKLQYVEKEIVQVEKHNKCKCDCRVKQEDCTPMQEYSKNDCRCICRNMDEEKKCHKNNATKLWNPDTCTCQCREEKICSTGTVFDWNDCKCVLNPMRRRYAEFPQKRSGYKSDALPVIPLRSQQQEGD